MPSLPSPHLAYSDQQQTVSYGGRCGFSHMLEQIVLAWVCKLHRRARRCALNEEGKWLTMLPSLRSRTSNEEVMQNRVASATVHTVYIKFWSRMRKKQPSTSNGRPRLRMRRMQRGSPEPSTTGWRARYGGVSVNTSTSHPDFKDAGPVPQLDPK